MEKTKAVWTNETVISGDFGILDSKGRMIGFCIKIFDVEYVEFSQDVANVMYYSNKPVGKYFAFQPHATRNGKTYGACQQDQEYLTKSERDAAIQKYIESAKKRNQRKFK